VVQSNSICNINLPIGKRVELKRSLDAAQRRWELQVKPFLTALATCQGNSSYLSLSSMRISSSSCDELARQRAIEEYRIVDTPCEPLFDDITKLASQICDAPISVISFVEAERQWFKSALGLSIRETPRSQSICAHAIESSDDIFVVADVASDPRFSANPLVTEAPHIGFYAGAKLVTAQGQAIGTVCVMDTAPRELDDSQIASLRILARQVVSQLESRRNYRLLEETARQLKAQEDQSQSILNHVPAFVFYKDTENRILRTNQAVADSLGLSIGEIEGRMTAELYPDQADDYYLADLEVIQSGEPKLGIVETIDTGGDDLRWIITDKIPIKSDGGEVESLLVIASDITKLKTVEESLRESQDLLRAANETLEQRVQLKTQQLAASDARYKDLYHNAPDMFISVNPNTSLILECNDTLLNELGYQRDEIIGQPIYKLYHSSNIEAETAVISEFRAKGRVRNREITLARKDGSPLDISLNISAIRDEEGRIVASRSVCRDITERKRLEKESRRHLNQLTHLARVATMNEMATGLSHELNQPLNAIKNYAKGTLRRLDEASFDSVAMASAIENIANNADRAAHLIAELRRYVKPSGKVSSKVDPQKLARRVVKILSHEVVQHNCIIELSTQGEPVAISCDEVQIEQVLINLLLNSAEAMAEQAGDNRTIELIIQQLDSKWVRFAVQDRGPGLTQGELTKMFDAFYTNKSTGLGMGLAICKTIVETHGGSLHVLANSPAGLTMALDLPVRHPG